MKKILIVIAVCLFGFLTYKLIYAYDRRADGFAIDKIHSNLPYNPDWDIPVTQEQIETANEILKQPFHYLARGFQCYAFESADHKYVLKFFRHQRLRLPEIVEALPNLPFIKEFKERKAIDFQKRMLYLFVGIKVGFELAPEETALIFVHLNKTKNQHGTVHIIDRAGWKHVVEMDNVEFMLQPKAMHIKPTIEKLMAEGKVDEAKMRLHQIFDLLVTCAKKGVHDTDGALIRKNNLGFLDDRAIYIDSGKLVYKDSIKMKECFAKDLKRLNPLRMWLEEKYPSLVSYFDEEKMKAINAF
ncbi:MAG: hypothetical protein JWO53_779 [Chlamydiia bacterium]|nr:hypothetical protein [Chlamydiia bacterium]